MKFGINNPAFLQMAGQAGKANGLFYITSNADDNELTFENTKLGIWADNIQYSTDGAQTWEQLTDDLTLRLNEGETVYFRNYTGDAYNSDMSTKIVNVADLYSIGGNITKLFYPGVQLPAYAFRNAFARDTSLQNASELLLPATELAEHCYESMFAQCTSLITAPALPATELAEFCYAFMFGSSTSLTTAPALPATKLAESCCRGMFAQCTSLTTAPALPATELAESCYETMFVGCASLITAPALPATELAEFCYRNMFAQCTSLITAPALPATELAESCYETMFVGCASLTAITCLATSNIYLGTQEWLLDVAAEGTFTKAAGVVWPEGARGIPEGWTVVEA